MNKQFFNNITPGLIWFCSGFLLVASIAFSFAKDSPACVIRLDKMNVLYIGINNPVSILVSGVPESEVKIEANGITLEKVEGIHYIARAWTPGDGRITVSYGASNPQVFRFRVKRIPDPKILLGGKHSSGSIGSGEFKAQNGIMTLPVNHYEICEFCEIIGFNVIRVTKKADLSEIKNIGPKFNSGVRQLIDLAKPGDTYYFDDILVKCPGDKASRNMESLAFKIE